MCLSDVIEFIPITLTLWQVLAQDLLNPLPAMEAKQQKL